MAAASGRKQNLRELGGVETEKSQIYLYNEERAGVGDSFPVVGPN